jgi:hypothetical protein
MRSGAALVTGALIWVLELLDLGIECFSVLCEVTEGVFGSGQTICWFAVFEVGVFVQVTLGYHPVWAGLSKS